MHLTVACTRTYLASLIMVALGIGHVSRVQAVLGRPRMPRLSSLLSIGVSLSCEWFDQSLAVEDHILANTAALLAKRGIPARRRLQLPFGQSCLLCRAERDA